MISSTCSETYCSEPQRHDEPKVVSVSCTTVEAAIDVFVLWPIPNREQDSNASPPQGPPTIDLLQLTTLQTSGRTLFQSKRKKTESTNNVEPQLRWMKTMASSQKRTLQEIDRTFARVTTPPRQSHNPQPPRKVHLVA